VQQIFIEFLDDEIEIQQAQNQQGSLFFEMKKPFAEAMKGIEDARKKCEEAKQVEKEMKQKKKKNGKGIAIGNVQPHQQLPKKKEKKVPTNLMVIQPKKPIPNQLPKPVSCSKHSKIDLNNLYFRSPFRFCKKRMPSKLANFAPMTLSFSSK